MKDILVSGVTDVCLHKGLLGWHPSVLRVGKQRSKKLQLLPRLGSLKTRSGTAQGHPSFL